MAKIPKITISFGMDTRGLKKGAKESESIVSRMGRGLKTAFDTAALAVAGLAAAYIGEGVQAAIEAEKAERRFAKTLKNTTKATDTQVKAVEEYITATQMATGVNDDDLRESLEKLLVATEDVTKAQELQALALDISAGTGKDLGTVSAALQRAYNGNMGSLSRLGVALDEETVKSKDFTAAQKELNEAFGGQAAAAAETTAGKLAIMNEKWGEMQEEIGLIVLEGLEPLMDWATSPEGGKALEEFMDGFGAGVKMAAEQLPGVLEALKKIGRTAGSMGLNFDTFMNPQMMAAAAAFRVTPGPIQLKALAALAAYAAFDPGPTREEARNNALGGAKIGRVIAGSTAGIDYGSYFNGTWSGALAQGNNAWQQTGAMTNTNAPMYQINVSGATDPVATAKAVARAQAQAQRLSGTGTNGKGVG